MGTQQKRIVWIDNLKALGILLVVLAHHEDEIPKSVLKYIYSFHVPLFFFASGLVYLPQRYSSFKGFAAHKAKTLLVPYFTLSLLTYVFWVALAPLRTGEPPLSVAESMKGFAGIFISSHGIIWMTHNGPLWFLTCLYLVEVGFHILYAAVSEFKWGNTHWVLGIFLLLLSIFGNLDRLFVPFRLPWSVDTALTGIALFGVGFLAQSMLSELSAEISLRKVLLFISVGICSLVFSNLNDFVNLAFNRLGNYFYFYAASISGVGICVMICQTIPPNRVFNYLGRNSLMILALHLPALTILRGAQKVLLPNAWHVIGGSLLGAILCSMMQILSVVPADTIIKRYARFMVGWR